MKPAKMQRKPTTKDLDGQGPSRKSKNPRIQDRPRPAHNLSVSHGPVINIVHDDEPDQHAGQRSSVLSLSEGTRNTASRSQVFSRESPVNTLQPDQTSSTSDPGQSTSRQNQLEQPSNENNQAHIPLKIKEKIWNGEFIELSVLLKSNRCLVKRVKSGR